MYNYLKRTWAEIDLDCISHNVKSIRSLLAPDCKLLGVVKADAYGHGDKTVALQMQQDGVDWFGISNVEEGVGLREAGITGPILIFGATPVEWVETLAKHRITQALFSPEYAVQLSQAAVEARVQVDVHVKVDTGMTRLGFLWREGGERETAAAIAALCALPGLSLLRAFPAPGFFFFLFSLPVSLIRALHTSARWGSRRPAGAGCSLHASGCCRCIPCPRLPWPDPARPGVLRGSRGCPGSPHGTGRPG